ncbi:TonB-dependent receptor [Sphingomonas sp.]|uniref:TonB-dependent receptor n=1 Tax=Sphingomonas sp. TaxID=28214 RepID=UPI002ED8F79F
MANIAIRYAVRRVGITRMALALLAGTALTTPALAQVSTAEQPKPEPQTVTAPLPAQNEGLQDIIVTAQRRSENLQEVPVSVVAITAEDALVRGVTGTLALTATVPGLVINNPASVGNPYLRGVGSNLFDPSAEQGVALYVDGVYIASPQANLFSFNNIEQIEVLRGPQGTLFGRNATGGVIQITTRKPSSTPSADLSVGYGNYDAVTVGGYVTGGLAENLAVDLAGLYENQGEGFGRNLTLNRDQYHLARGNYSLRSKMLWEPGAGTSITLAGDYAHAVSTAAYQKPQGTISPTDGSTYPGEFNSNGDLYNRNRVNTGGASLRVEQDIGTITVMNIASYRKANIRYDLDNDVTARRAGNVNFRNGAHNWSNELQIIGPDTGTFKWIVGGYYFDSVGEYFQVLINGNRSNEDKQRAVAWAGFGQATAQISARTDLTLGLRYTTEKQTFTQTFSVVRREEQSFDKLTWRAALRHEFTEDVSAYVSYNRGFKSGGYNLRLPGNSFQPETLDAYEVGLKTELFDRRLRFNVGGFWYDDKNVQVLSAFLGGTITSNAAAARIRGFEADFEAAVTPEFRLSGGLSIQGGEYTSYPNGVSLTQNGVRTFVDQRGNETIVTPPFSGTLTATYNADLGDSGRLQPSVTLTYNDRYYWQSDNRLTQPAFTLLNASLLWTSPSKRFDVRLWGKNLTDATYYIARLGVTGLGDVQEQAAPRTFGVTLGVHM